jgi:hypothetical protein
MNSETDQNAQPHGAEDFPARNGSTPESGNVDRIRNILFGSQMRDYEGRFQRLEERLASDAASLRADLQSRLDSLEAFMKGEVESMGNRLKAEQSERGHAVEKLARDLAETAKGLEMKVGHLDEQAAKDIRDLRQQLLDQSKALGSEIKEKNDQLKARLEAEAQLIRRAMTGRESLAEMLSEVALRLKGEFHVPGAR